MLHDNDQKFVLILDPAIPSEAGDDYYPASSGLADNIFVADENGVPVKGDVWPGLTYFPDFHDPKTQKWWQENVEILYSDLKFDGLWIDMNEPSS